MVEFLIILLIVAIFFGGSKNYHTHVHLVPGADVSGILRHILLEAPAGSTVVCPDVSTCALAHRIVQEDCPQKAVRIVLSA
jgi:hypothetical protein